MKTLLAAAALALAPALAAAPAFAETQRLEAEGSVAETMDRLRAAVEEAGATVFARVDHTQGARDAGMELPPAELLIFGNPKLGTPAMQDDPLAGLALPLRVLAYEAEGQTWLAWETPETLFEGLSLPEDAAYRGKIDDALDKLTRAAASAD